MWLGTHLSGCSKPVPSDPARECWPHTWVMHWSRRDWLFRVVGSLAASAGSSACSTSAHTAPDWTEPLRGNTIALLGEVHDHPALHTQRWQGLKWVVQAGWRPTVVMEQFDTEQQHGIDDARLRRPGDAAYLIEKAGRPHWDWPLYRPLLELALKHDLPLRAGNLSRERARRLVRGGWSDVFTAQELEALGLTGATPGRLLAGQQVEVHAGHCGALPAELLPGMARAQMARDAVMAFAIREALESRPASGVVLIAGNGHIRRDLGVPQWLSMLPPKQLWVVGFVEAEPKPMSSSYDQVVLAEAMQRDDPCQLFKPPVK